MNKKYHPQTSLPPETFGNKEKFCYFPASKNDGGCPFPFRKRLIDLIGSVLGLSICLPLFFLIGICIKLEDGGQIFFTQVRIGKGGRPFTIWKFRSMVVNAEELKNDLLQKSEVNGKIFKMRNDPRVTRVGKLIRRTSIDEFPQFWNVLTGELSLVGPRPAIDSEVRSYDQGDCRRLLTVNPGITGLTQITERMFRKKLDFHEQLQIDLEYIRVQSVILDLIIILKTPWAMIWGRGL